MDLLSSSPWTPEMSRPLIPQPVSSPTNFDFYLHLLNGIIEEWEDLCPSFNANNPDTAFLSLTSENAY